MLSFDRQSVHRFKSNNCQPGRIFVIDESLRIQVFQVPEDGLFNNSEDGL